MMQKISNACASPTFWRWFSLIAGLITVIVFCAELLKLQAAQTTDQAPTDGTPPVENIRDMSNILTGYGIGITTGGLITIGSAIEFWKARKSSRRAASRAPTEDHDARKSSRRAPTEDYDEEQLREEEAYRKWLARKNQKLEGDEKSAEPEDENRVGESNHNPPQPDSTDIHTNAFEKDKVSSTNMDRAARDTRRKVVSEEKESFDAHSDQADEPSLSQGLYDVNPKAEPVLYLEPCKVIDNVMESKPEVAGEGSDSATFPSKFRRRLSSAENARFGCIILCSSLLVFFLIRYFSNRVFKVSQPKIRSLNGMRIVIH